MKKSTIILVTLLYSCLVSVSQPISQNILGQVIDKQSKIPLPGATIIVLGTEPLVGITADNDGYFKLTDVKTGRVSLQVSFVGYESAILSNIILNSGKELVLIVELEESVTALQSVTVRARDKTKAINDMASISARTFSVEETSKYAGSWNDVARMAANYAGVRGADDSNNDIIIRGNSPMGLLWRLEGVDIPNPNHFGSFGATGGPVSMLNNNVLSNSDFFTGAFPAEYGNCFSGVFDLKMRAGNYENHEFTGQLGLNGLELGAEGPISREKRSSYLINYRYAMLDVVNNFFDLGTGSSLPSFQDLSFKFNFPSQKIGKITFFGLGGTSKIEMIASDEENEKENFYKFGDYERDVYFSANTGIIGASHTYWINNSTYTKLVVAATTKYNQNADDSISVDDRTRFPFFRRNFTSNNIVMNAYIDKKLNARHNFQTGVNVKLLNQNLVDSVWVDYLQDYLILTDVDGSTSLLQSYFQWQYKPTNSIVINSGVYAHLLTLKNQHSIEPRFGVRWSFSGNQTLSFGYGLHSQMAPLQWYFSRALTENQVYISPNKDLDFIKSHHFVLGYDWNITQNLRLKVETYYQNIFNAPVDAANANSFSLVNASSFTYVYPDRLENKGIGRNYGVELTLERFFNDGYYFLLTTSLYDSKYKGSDLVLHNTAFNGNYVVNVLGGKEWELAKSNGYSKYQKVISVSGKVILAGGQRYTPINVEASQTYAQTIYLDEKAYTERFNDYFKSDLKVSVRFNGKKVTHEIAFDLKNITNHENPLLQRFNVKTGETITVYQQKFIPLAMYKIQF